MKRSTCTMTGLKRISICLALLVIGSYTAVAQTAVTIDRALEIAMENSSDIRRTKLDLDRSRELLKAQKAALKSTFRLTLNPFSYNQDKTFDTRLSSWNRTNTKSSQGTFSITQPIEATDGTLSLTNRFSWQDSYSDYRDIRDKAFNNNLSLSFSQPIFTYNRTEMQLRQLELSLEQTLYTYALQKLNIERQVKQSFYSVYRSKMSLDITIEELHNQEQSYAIIKNKVDAGLAAIEQLYQAELNLASSKSSLQNSQVSLENTLDSFKQLIGISLTDSVAISADIEFTPVQVNFQKALDTALKNRTELRQSEISIENAQFSLIQTSAQNEFKGDVTLSFGLVGTDKDFGNMYDTPTNKQTVGLSFDIPLWDWGEKKARIKASQTTIERQKLSLEDQKISIEIGIRQAYRRLQNLVSQIDIAQQSIRNAQRTYDLNLERYKNGDLTSMDLNLFQTQLSQRKMGLVQAQIDYKLALLDIKIQSLWDFEKNEPVLMDQLY